jgi:hypothetical protein
MQTGDQAIGIFRNEYYCRCKRKILNSFATDYIVIKMIKDSVETSGK